MAEALIGAVLAAASVGLVARGQTAWPLARIAYGFALLGTLLGLTIVIVRGLGWTDLACTA